MFLKPLIFLFRAIELDSSNQVFYCNRAAAHSKMNNHYAAVEDCKRAIDMDPNYGKAYGRMGLAYSLVEKHKEAIECFKKAILLEPDNESYKSNLKSVEDKMASAGGTDAYYWFLAVISFIWKILNILLFYVFRKSRSKCRLTSRRSWWT